MLTLSLAPEDVEGLLRIHGSRCLPDDRGAAVIAS